MRLKELASYCESIKINCCNCDHKSECDRLEEELDLTSPIEVVRLVEENIELS